MLPGFLWVFTSNNLLLLRHVASLKAYVHILLASQSLTIPWHVDTIDIDLVPRCIAYLMFIRSHDLALLFSSFLPFAPLFCEVLWSVLFGSFCHLFLVPTLLVYFFLFFYSRALCNV